MKNRKVITVQIIRKDHPAFEAEITPIEYYVFKDVDFRIGELNFTNPEDIPDYFKNEKVFLKLIS